MEIRVVQMKGHFFFKVDIITKMQIYRVGSVKNHLKNQWARKFIFLIWGRVGP
jgi:hypothetical protein